MIKLIGCIMVVAAGAFGGNSIAFSFKRRLDTQALVLKMYRRTEIILEYSLFTFSEIVQSLKDCGEFSELGFLDVDCSRTDIRQAVLDGVKCWNEPDSGSKQILLSFFRDLGTTDLSGQLSFVKLAQAQQSEIVSTEKQRLRERMKLSRTFGVLGGAFAAIMLI